MSSDEALQSIALTPTDLDGCETARDLIDRVHEHYKTQHGELRWGKKMPRFVRHGELLKAFYPNARFIHVICDPRATVSSLIKSNVHRSNAYRGARRWCAPPLAFDRTCQ